MSDIPESATFSIEQDGRQIHVEVPRSTIEQAIAPRAVDVEAMAGWLQDNLDRLAEIARGKLANSATDLDHIRIESEDWQAG